MPTVYRLRGVVRERERERERERDRESLFSDFEIAYYFFPVCHLSLMAHLLLQCLMSLEGRPAV